MGKIFAMSLTRFCQEFSGKTAAKMRSLRKDFENQHETWWRKVTDYPNRVIPGAFKTAEKPVGRNLFMVSETCDCEKINENAKEIATENINKCIVFCQPVFCPEKVSLLLSRLIFQHLWYFFFIF